MSCQSTPNARAIISTVGSDRAGVVSGLAALITERELSIEDSRMCALGGEFATVISVTGAASALALLEQDLASYCAEQEMAHLFRLAREREQPPAAVYQVAVSAMDHPGIVRKVAAFFSERQLNIVDLSTDTQPAAHTGTPVFSLQMTVEGNASADTAALQTSFENFCDGAGLDGELTEA